MELPLLLKESFLKLELEIGIKPVAKSKRVISFFTIDDVSHSVKDEVKIECQKIVESMGRKSFQIDHPLIYSKDDVWFIKGGIWSIRIL